jgi:uncharacterized protein
VDHARSEGEAGRPEQLDRATCLGLIAGQQVGRLIFTIGALPAVRVMNFALADQVILLRTSADATAARRLSDVIVAFEVDELDPATSSGWSVTVTGRASLVTDPETVARYREVGLVPWALGVREQFMTISTEIVVGQRVGPAADPAASGAVRAAYS